MNNKNADYAGYNTIAAPGKIAHIAFTELVRTKDFRERNEKLNINNLDILQTNPQKHLSCNL